MPPPDAAKSEDEDRAPKRRNTGLMVGGIMLTSLGTVFAASGIAIAANARDRDLAGPVTMAVVGFACVAVGIPMIVVGARRVPPPSQARASFLLGPGAVAWRRTF